MPQTAEMALLCNKDKGEESEVDRVQPEPTVGTHLIRKIGLSFVPEAETCHSRLADRICPAFISHCAQYLIQTVLKSGLETIR